jgi:hypothetical protein
MFAKPQKEHHWLDALVGQWTFEAKAEMGPGQPEHRMLGKATGRSLGGLWVLIESEHAAEKPEEQGTTIMSLGYDLTKRKYVGSFVGSMMDFQWIYAGSLDESQRKLVLDTVGPRFDGQPGEAKYQDMLEQVSPDHWILSSQVLGDDGQWKHFMTSHHKRVG